MRRIALVGFVMALCGAASGMASAEERPPLDVGGGLLLGGYFGELRHDWQLGPGATLFGQYPLPSNLEVRLLGSMQWSDGTRLERISTGDPDLGAKEGELPRSLRRTALTASLLWRLERYPIGKVGVPYLGAGLGTYETRTTYDSPDGDANLRRTTSQWNQGFDGIAGVRLYRQTGMFLSLEGQLHGIDTPNAWTFAYDAAVLLGVMLGS